MKPVKQILDFFPKVKRSFHSLSIDLNEIDLNLMNQIRFFWSSS